MILPASILAEMVRTNGDLFRFALLFPEYAREMHRNCVRYHSSKFSTLSKVCDILTDGITVAYYRFGKLHRDGFNDDGAGPAVIISSIDGKYRQEQWYYMGQVHRPYSEGPAVETNNMGIEKLWFEWGKSTQNRQQIVSSMRRYCHTITYIDRTVFLESNGTVMIVYHQKPFDSYKLNCMQFSSRHYSERWRGYNRYDRTERPTMTMIGRIKVKKDQILIRAKKSGYQYMWFHKNQLHRIDGPAIESNRKYGDQWFIHGEPLMVWRAAPSIPI